MAHDTPTLPQSTPAEAQTLFGQSVGRYLLLSKLGHGGHGEVFKAYDPLLDRKVAIKLLHARDGRSQPAILNEARALARLSHANVVTIHDVGVDDEAFLAMELLEGGDLSAWRESTRTPAERLEVVLAAARGIAAAHAREIVHGDIKPANILLSAAGEVRVSDFGIARMLATADERAASGPAGTPAYMAPETAEGDPPDARSDQYSFCVLAWELLTGQHPRPISATNRAVEVTIESAESGEDTVSLEAMSGRLSTVLARGLSDRPQDRWPSMDALIEAIEDAAPKRRRWVGPAAFVGAASVAIGGWSLSQVDPCRHAADSVDALWAPSRQADMREALAATGKPTSEQAWALAQRRLDDYTQTLATLRTDTCRAAQEADDDDVRLRRSCLDRAAYHVQAVTQRLSEADASVVHHTHALLAGLPPLDTCLEPEQLSIEAPPPEISDEVQAILRQLVDARAEGALGNAEQARAFLDEAADAAKEIDHPPLHAELQLVEAMLSRREGRYEEAIALLDSALATSVGQRLWRPAFESTLALAHSASQLGDEAGGRTHAGLALGFAQALGGHHEDLAAAHNEIAGALEAAGDLQGAIGELERALELNVIAKGEDDVSTAGFLENLARTHRQAAQLEDAEAYARKALAVRKTALGDAHPLTARTLASLARIALDAGRPDEAEQHQRAAEQALVAALGEAHPEALVAKVDRASSLLSQHQYDDAIALLQRVIELASSSDKFTQRVAVMGHANLANALATKSGDSPEVRMHYRTALEILDRIGLAQSKHATLIGGNLANALLEAGEYEEAFERAQHSLETIEDTFGESHPDVAYPLITLGEVHQARGELEPAIAAFERALAIRLEQPRPELIAEARFELAPVLWEQGETTRAVELARLARDTYAEGGWDRLAAKVEAWLDEHAED